MIQDIVIGKKVCVTYNPPAKTQIRKVGDQFPSVRDPITLKCDVNN